MLTDIFESLKSLTTANRPIVTSTAVGATVGQELSQSQPQFVHELQPQPPQQEEPQPHEQPQLQPQPQGYLKAATRFIALPSTDIKGPLAVIEL